MSKRVLIVQHDHVSPPGPVGERFGEHGYEVVPHLVVTEDRFAEPGVDAEFPDFTAFDAVVAMGAPWSTYDHALIGSWVLPEIDQLRRADAAEVPVLGICFGGQLLATAHGGRVEASPSPEIGWAEVASDDESLVPGGPWFQWHYDRWELPPRATELARNPAASQAFLLRRNLAVQFHPELTTEQLEGWLGNSGAAKVIEGGKDPQMLLSQTRELAPDARVRAHRLVDAFVESVAENRQPVRR